MLARQLANALGQGGYAVDCAGDGEQADFLAHTEQYDAVVLDLGLPRIDGLTLLRRWRESGIAAPVLILTARGSWHEKVQGIDCGTLVLDPRTARVAVGNVPVSVTSHEFRVLSYLMHHGLRVVSRSELTEHIYAQNFDRDSNTIEVFIARLRRKLGGSFIETVRGLGYRMRTPATGEGS